MKLQFINFPEPQWGVKTLLAMHDFMLKHEIVMKLAPVMADVFVLAYPIYLPFLYLRGVYKRKDTYFQELSLFLFVGGFSTIFVDLIIQLFVIKARPDVVLPQIFNNRDALVMKNLPTATFPSDHMGMSAAIAMGTTIRAIQNKDKKLMRTAAVLWVLALGTGTGRILIGVHRPLDILVGMLLGMLIPAIIYFTPIYKRLQRRVFPRVITMQEWVWLKLFGYKRKTH